MVLLIMTPSIVEGLEIRGELAIASSESESIEANNEPSLEAPASGKPVSHSQILELWKDLWEGGRSDYTLEKLLHGARVYIPPPPPKPEPVSLPHRRGNNHPANGQQTPEYKALMARLRGEEEARAYDRMLNPPELPHLPPNAPFDPYAAVHRPSDPSDNTDDDGIAVVAKELNQQLMVVLNILLSVFGTAAAVWFSSRWWSITARVFLALGASILVAVADVVIFSGFVGRVRESKGRGKKEADVREVVGTWVVGGQGEKTEGEKPVDGEGSREEVIGEAAEENTNLRRRNKPPS